MPTILNQGIPVLLNTIDKKIRHRDYKDVCELAKDYETYGIASQDGITAKLKRFHGGETEELFAQRVVLTSVNVTDIWNSCVKPLNKVSKTPATIDLTWEGSEATENVTKRKVIQDVADNFWGTQSVNKYLANRMGQTDSLDPNSFLIVEFAEQIDSRDSKTLKAKPYPFEVNSEEAINYVYKNNELQWLIILKEDKMLNDKKQLIESEKYYMYLDNDSISATQIHKKTYEDLINANPNAVFINNVPDLNILIPGVDYYFGTSEENANNKRYFIVKVFNHNMKRVPAKRFGTITNPESRHRTCIPVIHPAKNYFEDSIQTMSEFSITKRLHTFPQKWQYLPKCDVCYKGYKNDGITKCESCKGTGTITHSSAQDIIGIRMPDDLKDIVSLENMSAYKGPDIELVKFQKEFGFEDLRRYAQSAVYNNEVGRRRVKTATESEIDFDAVHDTLKPFADNWSDMYEFIYLCIAELLDLGKGFNIVHIFPDDFQMETLTEILEDLKKANENGAPSHVKKALTKKLTNKTYIDQPNEILKIETKDKFYPYAGKSEAEVQFILANGKTTKYAETLYAHFDLIFSDLEFAASLKNIDFYQLEEKIQRDLVKAKVQEYVKEINDQAAAAAAANFVAAPGA